LVQNDVFIHGTRTHPVPDDGNVAFTEICLVCRTAMSMDNAREKVGLNKTKLLAMVNYIIAKL